MASGLGFSTPPVPRSAAWFFHERRRRRQRRQGYGGWPIRVEQIAERDNLYHCWQQFASEGGKGPGVDGYTYTDFSPGEVGQMVGDVSEQVLAGVYWAEPVRVVPIPKHPGSDQVRRLKIGTLCDRVLGKALDNAFKKFWEKRFLPWSFGFRPRRCTWDLLADLEAALRTTRRGVLAVDDVKNAFDNVPIGAVIECHRAALARVRQENFGACDKGRTLALIEAVLRGHDRQRQQGIDQGAPYSPTALNVLLDTHHDRRIKEILKQLLWWRYGDNLAYLCRSMTEGEQVLEEVSRLLEPLGMTLKGKDGIKDLYHGETAHLLGFSLWWDSQMLHCDIGPDALDDLRQHLGHAHVTPDPARNAREAALGWVAAYAPAFEDGNVAVVLTTLVDCGFREQVSLTQFQERWQAAWGRWQRYRSHRRLPRR